MARQAGLSFPRPACSAPRITRLAFVTVTDDDNVADALRNFAYRLDDAQTPDAVGKALLPVAALFKFTNIVINDASKAMTDPARVVVFSARSIDEARAIAQRSPLANNPVLQVAWAAPEPISLTEIRTKLGLEPEALWKLLPPWRGFEGLSINVALDPRTVWNIGFAGAGGDAGPAARSVMKVASRMACERLRDIERAETPTAQLSPREEEALRLAAGGKTDAEIGKAMGVAPRTVRFHIDNAKTKLGVSNRTQAVLRILRGDR